MKPRSSGWLPVLIMLLLAMTTSWLVRLWQTPEGMATTRARHDPDVIIDDVSYTRLDQSGKPRYRLTTEKMLHYPDNDSTLISNPMLNELLDSMVVGKISANEGQLDGNGERVRLYGNVSIEASGGSRKEGLRARTAFLEINPERDTMRTDQSVDIERGRARLSGTGMEIDNRARTLRLFSNVRGDFEVGRSPAAGAALPASVALSDASRNLGEWRAKHETRASKALPGIARDKRVTRPADRLGGKKRPQQSRAPGSRPNSGG